MSVRPLASDLRRPPCFADTGGVFLSVGSALASARRRFPVAGRVARIGIGAVALIGSGRDRVEARGTQVAGAKCQQTAQQHETQRSFSHGKDHDRHSVTKEVSVSDAILFPIPHPREMNLELAFFRPQRLLGPGTACRRCLRIYGEEVEAAPTTWVSLSARCLLAWLLHLH